MWHYVLSRIWGNLNRDKEIDRNQRSEELLKLGGVQKIFIFRRGLPHEREVRNFSFSARGGRGAFPIKRGGGYFLGGGSYLFPYSGVHCKH